jgi:glycosyltransferase involved in cell wall biosynthesis
LAAREEEEWGLADCILCGSQYVADGLASMGVERSKCRVMPYGLDIAAFRPREGRSGSDLNVLFVGAVGLRKGVPDLLEAIRRLRSGRIRCRLAGAVELNQQWLAERLGSAEVLGQLPRSEVISMYHWADVLVLPSICEGSAVSTYEALACGVPVITTPNAGSVIRDGMDGFVVPIRNPDAIAACLQSLLEDRDLLSQMSVNARQRSKEFSLDRYAARLISLLTSLPGENFDGVVRPRAASLQ